MIIRVASVVVALAGSAAAQDMVPAVSANYACDGNAVLQVAYLNPEGSDSLAVVGWAGKLIPMRQGPSGSGARFIAFDEQQSYRWHTKGREGTLVFLAADHTAEEATILSNCVQIGD